MVEAKPAGETPILTYEPAPKDTDAWRRHLQLSRSARPEQGAFR